MAGKNANFQIPVQFNSIDWINKIGKNCTTFSMAMASWYAFEDELKFVIANQDYFPPPYLTPTGHTRGDTDLKFIYCAHCTMTHSEAYFNIPRWVRHDHTSSLLRRTEMEVLGDDGTFQCQTCDTNHACLYDTHYNIIVAGNELFGMNIPVNKDRQHCDHELVKDGYIRDIWHAAVTQFTFATRPCRFLLFTGIQNLIRGDSLREILSDLILCKEDLCSLNPDNTVNFCSLYLPITMKSNIKDKQDPLINNRMKVDIINSVIMAMNRESPILYSVAPQFNNWRWVKHADPSIVRNFGQEDLPHWDPFFSPEHVKALNGKYRYRKSDFQGDFFNDANKSKMYEAMAKYFRYMNPLLLSDEERVAFKGIQGNTVLARISHYSDLVLSCGGSKGDITIPLALNRKYDFEAKQILTARSRQEVVLSVGTDSRPLPEPIKLDEATASIVVTTSGGPSEDIKAKFLKLLPQEGEIMNEGCDVSASYKEPENGIDDPGMVNFKLPCVMRAGKQHDLDKFTTSKNTASQYTAPQGTISSTAPVTCPRASLLSCHNLAVKLIDKMNIRGSKFDKDKDLDDLASAILLQFQESPVSFNLSPQASAGNKVTSIVPQPESRIVTITQSTHSPPISNSTQSDVPEKEVEKRGALLHTTKARPIAARLGEREGEGVEKKVGENIPSPMDLLRSVISAKDKDKAKNHPGDTTPPLKPLSLKAGPSSVQKDTEMVLELDIGEDEINFD